jgi:hypothetical protein
MKKLAYTLIITMAFLCVLSTTCNIYSIWTGHVTSSMKDAVVNYDNFQETYNTCVKLNNDLAIIQETPDTDAQFSQFSKAQRINAIKINLNRWIEDYNAKSKEIDKNLWKSSSLPYQLKTTDFSNYK